MKKEELMNGSIVVTRGGYLGVVIRDEDDGYILYQKIGIDDLADFNDDLTSKDGEDWDIIYNTGLHVVLVRNCNVVLPPKQKRCCVQSFIFDCSYRNHRTMCIPMLFRTRVLPRHMSGNA